MPSPDYKWLKCLHCNVVVGYIIFLDSFTRGFGRKRLFLKIRQAWVSDLACKSPRLQPLFVSIFSEKLRAVRVLSTDPFQEGGLQHPTHTHTHTDTILLSLIHHLFFFCLQHLENLKKMVKGTDAL